MDSATPVARLSVRGESGPLPGGCGLHAVAQLVEDFLDAFNRGDSIVLHEFFPAEAAYPDTTTRGFQWYSVTDEFAHFVTYDPAELPAYFAARHAQHERLQLLALEVAAGPNGGACDRVDIAFRLARHADDRPAHLVVGKGAIDCEDQTIFVWSTGAAVGPPPAGTPAATPTS